MALPSTDYRDPLEILIEREAQTCKGCIHQRTERAFGVPITVCLKTDKDGKQREHGRRCVEYQD